ncbi:MAG: hypothetical protein M1819_006099 [Sarea resinae]|nr:MAG: hypothetical protein M1819_006099 [Sarea resinae]
MASPAKRRKKNDGRPAPSATRSLDYFFGKQNKEQGAPGPSTKTFGATNGSLNGQLKEEPDALDNGLTDEELARKLQAQWDEEDALRNAQLSQSEEPSSSINPPKEDLLPQPDMQGNGSEEANTAMKEEPSSSKKHVLSLQSASSTEDTISTTIPFDESPLTFAPSRYLPELRKHWTSEGGDATYALLTRCFVLVNSTQSRIKIVDTLVNLLRTIIEGDPESLLPAVWLATNSISPSYISLELGLGGSAISKALKKVCGLDNQGLKTLYNKHGDAGDVAFEAKKRQTFTLRKPKPLSIKSVYQSLVKIANSKGNGSQEVKQRIVERLVQDARGAEESRYIVRTLVQHLRIGAVKTTMLIALSRAFLLSRPVDAEFHVYPQSELSSMKKDTLTELYAKAEEIVKACFARRPNYNDLVPGLLEVGVCDELLLRCGLALHIPLRPMLGNITRDLDDMLTKLQGRQFSCEYKYDGQRAQVHCDERGKVTIFSRHLEVMTDKYPDLVALVPQIRGEGVGSFIMEGEVVAVDQQTGDLKTFQTLANRARKDVVIGSVKVEVCLFAFDLMYLNGEELLDRPLRERRELLRSLFVEVPLKFTWVKSLDATSADSEAVLGFFKSALDIKCEGIMVKVLDNVLDPPLAPETEGTQRPAQPAMPSKTTARKTKAKSKPKSKLKPPITPPDTTSTTTSTTTITRRKPLLATYEPDKRIDSWLKVKKDYSTSQQYSETLDVIPIAAWHGQGRKAAWWSPILLAVRNADSGALEPVCKCISGFTDKFYIANRKRYRLASEVEEEEEEKEEEKEEEEEEEGKQGEHKAPRDGNGNAGHEDDDIHNNKPPSSPPSPSPSPSNTNTTTNTLAHRPPYIPPPPSYPGIADVYFAPQEVWELAFADVTLSPTYPAARGLVDPDRGLSLRFPRFLRVRDDKGVEDASSSEFLAELYRRQDGKALGAGVGGGKTADVEDVEGEEGGGGYGEEEGKGDEGEGEGDASEESGHEGEG